MVSVGENAPPISDKSRVAFSNSSLRETNRVCWFCKKTFCCTECRDRHANVAHPDLNANCTLCSARILPIRQYVFEKLSLEEDKLLRHIACKHLPLRCTLCGDRYETVEDLKSFGPCKWYSERHRLLTCGKQSLPGTPAQTNLQANLKQRCTSSNGSVFHTPPEIYRNTSTPMFLGQKNGLDYQTPCPPNFSLKTPGTSSPWIATRNNTTSCTHESRNADSDVKFFSFSPHTSGNEGTTPFRTACDEQFSRSNSGRILNIKKEPDETTDNETEEINNEEELSSPVDMDLTDVEGGLLQDFPRLDTVHEESDDASSVVKRVRFSDQHKALPEFENEAVSYAKSNMTGEETFHDAHDVSQAKCAKSSKNTEDKRDSGNTEDKADTKNTKDTEKNLEDARYTNDSQAKVQKQYLVNSLNNLRRNSQAKIFQDNEKNEEKENQGAEVLVNSLSITNQQSGTSRMLMMLLVENSSGSLDHMMPLINAGLKKLEKEIAPSASSITADPSFIANSGGCTRKSITKLEMNISSVESYSKNNAMTNHRQVVSSSSPLSSAQNSESSSGGGILSAVAQAVRYAFKNLTGVTSSGIQRNHMIQGRKDVEESISSPGSSSSSSSASSNLDGNLESRPGKRSRDINEMPSRMDPIACQLDIRSPLAKRHRGFYKIRGRQPISRMRNNGNRVTSPRGVSSETQVFSQGSLTVGDTILPLPGRAHQSTQTK